MRQDVLRGIGLTVCHPVANGLPMAVEFDEVERHVQHVPPSLSSDQFGTLGVADTGFGPHGYLIMNPDTVTGTIERDGTIALPAFRWTAPPD